MRPIERIQRQSEFRQVFRGGGAFRDPILRIHYLENHREVSRLGLVVSRKVGKAVVRNRVKRMLRAVFREAKSEFQVNMDVVLVPNPGACIRNR